MSTSGGEEDPLISRVIVPSSIVVFVLVEIVLIAAAYTSVVYLLAGADPRLYFLQESGLISIVIVVLLIVSGLYLMDLYSPTWGRSRILLLQQLCFLMGLVFLAQAILGYVKPGWAMPPKMMMSGSALVLLMLFVSRLLFNLAVASEFSSRKLLFVGVSPAVRQLNQHLLAHPEFGLKPIGYLDTAPEAADTGLPRLASPAELMNVVDRLHPNTIAISSHETVQPCWVPALQEMRFWGLQIEETTQLYETTFGRTCALEMRPTDLITSPNFDPDPAMLRIQLIYSRLFAVVLIAATLPMWLVAAILIRISSSAPVLQRDRRVGEYGCLFTLYRFRCTRGGPNSQASSAIGKLLRHVRLDSLPILLNILKGDMVMVGPSPLRPEFVDRLKQEIPFFNQRHRIKPGFVGWAQINHLIHGATEDIIETTEFDLYYLKNLSLSLDLFILVRSLKALLLGAIRQKSRIGDDERS